MKNHFSSVSKLVAVAMCALSLGSCSRSEYAMLPKGSSYHGVSRVAAPVPASAAPTTASAPAETTVATAPAVEAPAQKVAKAPAVAVQKPVTTQTPEATQAAAATVAAAPSAKPSLVQRIAMNKVARKMDKLMQKSGSVRQHDNTASTARGSISGNLRIGLILLLVGILIGLIPGLGLIGTIVAIIGIVFIVLWLLDQL